MGKIIALIMCFFSLNIFSDSQDSLSIDSCPFILITFSEKEEVVIIYNVLDEKRILWTDFLDDWVKLDAGTLRKFLYYNADYTFHFYDKEITQDKAKALMSLYLDYLE